MNGRAERDSTSIQRGPPDPPMHRPSTPRAEARAPACPAVERAAPSAPCNQTTVCDTRPFQEALNRNGRPMGSCQDRLTGAGVPAAAPSAALATRGRNVRLEATLFGPNILSPSKNAFFYSIFYFLFLFCTRCPRPRKLGSSFAHVEHPCSAGVKRNESSRRSGDFGKTSAPTDS